MEKVGLDGRNFIREGLQAKKKLSCEKNNGEVR